MTLKELNENLSASGLPVAYKSFPADSCPQMPFVVFYEIGTHNFGADGRVYHPVKQIRIELYTKNKSEGAEALLEDALDTFTFWDKVAEIDDDEKCLRQIYEIEIGG